MKNLKSKSLLFFFLSVFLISTVFTQSINYDQKNNAFSLTGYRKEKPATLKTLLEYDKKNGLNIISYDEPSKTFTVNASLWIGDDEAMASYFQIGDENYPVTTVILKGNLWVKPMAKSMKRTDGLPSVLNYLKIGDKNNESIKVNLKFAPGFAFIIGDRKGKRPIMGGCIDIFNSKISCTVLKKKGKYWRTYNGPGGPTSGPAWYATAINLQNSEFSGFNGPFYGINTSFPHYTIKNCVFRDGAAVLGGGYQYVEGCTFENIGCAIRCSKAKAINCVFRNNDYNWKIYIDNLIFLNCDIGSQNKPICVVKRSSTNKKLMMLLHQQNKVYPSAIIEKSFQVKVLDSNGKPVKDAGVSLTCKEKPEAVIAGIAMTDKNGITPADLKDALIITTKEFKAGNDPNKPLELFYKYKITIIYKDRIKLSKLDSRKKIPPMLTIIMD